MRFFSLRKSSILVLMLSSILFGCETQSYKSLVSTPITTYQPSEAVNKPNYRSNEVVPPEPEVLPPVETLPSQPAISIQPNLPPAPTYNLESGNSVSETEDRKLRQEMNRNRMLRVGQEGIIDNYSRLCPSSGRC
jgi:hypothetical protein